MRVSRILSAFTFLFLPLPLQSQGTPPRKPASPLDRVVVLGASLSAGFGNLLPLHMILRKAFPERKWTPKTLENRATSLFFLQPLATGKFQVDKALDFKPTLAVGLDFLFWYLYGQIPEKARLGRLEKGLKQVERLGKIPVLLGDIPDMHGASPDMLPPDAIPSRETLKQANRRIHAWAKKHANILLFPLAEFTEKTKAKGWILKPQPGEKPAFQPLHLTSAQLLQKDRLHPSRAGAWLLGRLLVQFMEKRFPALKKKGSPRIPASLILGELPGASQKGKEIPAPKKEKKPIPS